MQKFVLPSGTTKLKLSCYLDAAECRKWTKKKQARTSVKANKMIV